MRPVTNLGTVDSPARLPGLWTSRHRHWRTTYLRRLIAVDATSALAAAAMTTLLDPRESAQISTLPVLALLVPVLWVATLALAGAYERRLLEDGRQSSRRVGYAAVLLVAAIGTVSWGLQMTIPRGFVLAAVLGAGTLTLAQRHWHRAWLRHRRAKGECMHQTLLVGDPDAVAALHQQLRQETQHGYRVVGCCLPTAQQPRYDGMPVLGDLSQVVDLAEFHEVDAVAVVPAKELDGGALHRLARHLAWTRAKLMLAPSLAEVAGPRVRTRPSLVLPLLHAERPGLWGTRRLVKEAFDRGVALAALALVVPVLAAVAVAIKLTSGGPVLVREERVGRHGRVFGMLHFRSTVADDDRPPMPQEGVAEGARVRFPLGREPRMTPLGRLLHRHRLDDLPRLFNVLRGDMSLVGPRPALPLEVYRYGAVALRRRIVVKPGLIGVGQAGSASDLTSDDAACMDVRYLEDWSLSSDVMILVKRLAAVLRGDGAY